MSRSTWKGIFFSHDFCNYRKNKVIYDRQTNSLPLFKDKVLSIHNGKQIVAIKFNKDEMFGHCVGEFVFTKRKCVKLKKE